MLSTLRLIGTALAAATVVLAVPSNVKYIVPGAKWLDTDGNFISNHAGSIVLNPEDGLYYWFGQDVKGELLCLACHGAQLTSCSRRQYRVPGSKEPGRPMHHARLTPHFQINIYSSPDLATWTRIGHAIGQQEGVPELSADSVVERPKVVYNELEKQWRLWWHSDNHTYGLLKQAVATSPTIKGPYTFLGSHSPLGDFSQDFGLFQDDDGEFKPGWRNARLLILLQAKYTRCTVTGTRSPVGTTRSTFSMTSSRTRQRQSTSLRVCIVSPRSTHPNSDAAVALDVDLEAVCSRSTTLAEYDRSDSVCFSSRPSSVQRASTTSSCHTRPATFVYLPPCLKC